MDLPETEKRIKSFQQHHCFAIVSHTLYPQKQTLAVTNHVEVSSDSSSSSSDDESDQEVASELTEEQFDIIMDTLSVKSQLQNIDKDIIDMSPVMDNIPIIGRNLTGGIINKKTGIRVTSHTKRGPRPKQEDRVTVVPDIDQTLPEHTIAEPPTPPRAFFAVYDGHGGDECVRLLQSHFLNAARQHPQFRQSACGDDSGDLVHALRDTCDAVDETICRALSKTGDTSGGAALFVVWDKDERRLTVANVGDCRAVLGRFSSTSGGGNKAVVTTLLTKKQHRVSCPEESKRVIREGGRVRNSRFNGVLALTRSFGDVPHKISSCYNNNYYYPRSGSNSNNDERTRSTRRFGGPLTPIPDITVHDIDERDEFMVLASDGLWDVMPPPVVVNTVRTALADNAAAGGGGGSHNVDAMAERLVNEAFRRGSVDNVAVIVVFFHQGGGDDASTMAIAAAS